MTVLNEISAESKTSSAQTPPSVFRSYFSKLAAEPPAPWNALTVGGLVSLLIIWAAWFYGTWGYWGNLSADCGREMYVATVLSEGKTLYRDVWFNFGPAAPHFNSFLFRLFGVHLNVLYWAGSLAALGSAIFLFLAGMRLSASLAGWTAAAVLLCEAFHPSLFSFPLPYSFAAVYGCLITCFFIWLAIRASSSSSMGWIFASAWATAIAILLKPEFGASCCIALMFLIAARAFQRQTWKSIPKDLLAILPAALACCLVIAWMISIKGVEFLTQENFQSWPTSYFMRTYGKAWLAFTGFSLTGSALTEAAFRIFVFLAVLQGLSLITKGIGSDRRSAALRIVLFFGAVVYLARLLDWRDALRWISFPQDMLVIITITAAASWWYFLREPGHKCNPAAPLLLTVSALIAIRILLKMLPWSYPVFFNGPAVLSFFVLLGPFFSRTDPRSRFAFRGELLICCACLFVTLINSRRADFPTSVVVPLVTERGTIKVSPSRAEQYRAAIDFMREKNVRGEYVLSVPEDTSLYFLSGTHCPTRVFAFTPGLVVPGKMTDELIHEVETKNVRFLIWSNRIFWEYGVPRFGVDFDQTFGNYLRSHYHSVGPVSPAPVRLGEWNAYIWERNSESAARQSPLGDH
jgi:hypothetical protein